MSRPAPARRQAPAAAPLFRGLRGLFPGQPESLHKKLQMEKIGVSITPACILTPEKSVTAIGAIP